MRCIVVVALAGCVTYADSVHVRVKDPAQVAVTGVLAAGAAHGDIPETMYVNQPVPGAWIDRGDATLDLWCPSCVRAKRETLALAPELVIAGASEQAVRVEGDRVHVRYVFSDWSGRVWHGKHGYWHESRPRIALDLETPVTNVTSIDAAHIVDRGKDPEFDRRMDIGAAVWGGVWIAGGAAIGGLGLDEHDNGIVVAGIAMAVIGTTLLALQIHVLRAHDEHRAIRF